jgi:hypothetical protein
LFHDFTTRRTTIRDPTAVHHIASNRLFKRYVKHIRDSARRTVAQPMPSLPARLAALPERRFVKAICDAIADDELKRI